MVFANWLQEGGHALVSSGSDRPLLAEELQKELISARMGLGFDQQGFAAALSALSEVGLPEQANHRAELASAWRKAGELVAETEGHTPFLLELLTTAAALDPQDETLAAEAAYQAGRHRINELRLESAQAATSN